MLEPIRHILARQRNVLASTSPRRKELLKSVNFTFDVFKPSFEENLLKSSFSHPCEYVKENAKQKAISVWQSLAVDPKTKVDLVIGCDTVVTLDDEIFEKPKSENDAHAMLTRLSGRSHTVFTGVALITNSNNKATTSGDGLAASPEDFVVTTFHEATTVTMAELTDQIIESYIATGEPLDKAGAYGIQGIGATLIESVRGDYFNVVGLPLHRLAKELYSMYMDQ